MLTMLTELDVQQRRNELRLAPQCTFVNADEFRTLAISIRHLSRRDEQLACLRGLVDIETGETFFTEEENLFGA